uniref:DUF3453 domain-containing protein n=1 Tax=Rhabditophanes sp. KR3021 TaxID=114890 RepID=A0AC35TY00_9BILA
MFLQKSSITGLYKRKNEISDAIQNLTEAEMLRSLGKSEFMSSVDGQKIIARFYPLLNATTFRDTFFGHVLTAKPSQLDNFGALLIVIFTYLKKVEAPPGILHNSQPQDVFVAVVVSKLFEIGVLCVDEKIQSKMTDLFISVCKLNRQPTKAGNTILKDIGIRPGENLLFMGCKEHIFRERLTPKALLRLRELVMQVNMFPINPRLKIDSTQNAFTWQIKYLKAICGDEYVPIRSYLAKELPDKLGLAWLEMDVEDIQFFIGIFANQFTSDSVGVIRVNAYKGLKALLNYSFAHTVLRKLIKGKIKSILCDGDASVRNAGLEFLIKAAEFGCIDELNIPEAVLYLDMEKDLDNTKLAVKLLVGYFFGEEFKSGNDEYINLFEIFSMYRFANFTFNKWLCSLKCLTLSEMYKHIKALLRSANSHIKAIVKSTEPMEEAEIEKHRMIIRVLIEATAYLWSRCKVELAVVNKSDSIEAIHGFIAKLAVSIEKIDKNGVIHSSIVHLMSEKNGGTEDEGSNEADIMKSIKSFATPPNLVSDHLTFAMNQSPQILLDFLNKGLKCLENHKYLEDETYFESFSRTIEYLTRIVSSPSLKDIIAKDWNFYFGTFSKKLAKIEDVIVKKFENGKNLPKISNDFLIQILKLAFVCRVFASDSNDYDSNESYDDTWTFWQKMTMLIEEREETSNTTLLEKLKVFANITIGELVLCYGMDDRVKEGAKGWIGQSLENRGSSNVLISFLKMYISMIEAFYHSSDMINGIKNDLYSHIPEIIDWSEDAIDHNTFEDSKKEILKLWKLVDDKFQSLKFIKLDNIPQIIN